MAPRAAPKKEEGAKAPLPTDLDEEAALSAAAAALDAFGASNNHVKAAVAIGTWIITRARLSAGKRLTDTLVFDLGDSKLQGFVEAGLGKVADALGAAGFDFTKSFNDLSKEEAVMLFVAGAVAHREAAVAAGEAPDFPFSDPIPFGGG